MQYNQQSVSSSLESFDFRDEEAEASGQEVRRFRRSLKL